MCRHRCEEDVEFLLAEHCSSRLLHFLLVQSEFINEFVIVYNMALKLHFIFSFLVISYLNIYLKEHDNFRRSNEPGN